MSELDRRVRSWRLQRWRALWTEGLLRFASLLGAYLLAAVLLDRILSLPQAARWAVFWAGLLACASGIAVYLLYPLRHLYMRDLLSAVSRRYPGIGESLRPAWELSRSGSLPNTSRELLEEHLERTEGLLEALPSESAFPVRPTRRASVGLVCVAAAWGLGLPWIHGHPASLRRVLAPWTDVSLDASVEVVPGDRKVVWAEPVEIRARWRVAAPETARRRLALYIRSEGFGFERVPWDREDAAGGSFAVARLTSVIEYRVGARDLRTRVYRITPLPYPQLTDVRLRVQLPGRGPGARETELAEGGEVAALRGSWVTLRGRCGVELESASLLVSYLNEPVRMTRGPGGGWEAGFPLKEDGTLRIDLVSAEGVRDPDPVAYPMRALEDEPPEVELLSPAFELEVSPSETIPVTYAAQDDYGLASLSLVFRVDRDGARGTERRLPLARLEGHPVEHLGDYEWDLSGMPVGSSVEFRIRASDNGRPDPNTAVSDKGVLHIVDFDSMHAITERIWARSETRLRRLSEAEKRMSELLAGLSTASASGLMEDAFRRQAELEDRWDETVGSMEELARNMREDPYANPGMSELTAALGETLRGLKETDLRSARKALDAREARAAAEIHKRLEEKTRRASGLLEAGREMQAMQDFWSEAHRMDRTGGEIQEALERISKSGRPPNAQEKAELDKALSELQGMMGELSKAIDKLPQADPGSLLEQNRKVYVVPLDQARGSLDALQAALARGDYEAAARIARRLAAQLSQVREAIAKAASNQAERSRAPSERLKAALELWDDVIEQQAASLERTQQVSERKLAELLQAQKDLLRELAGLQDEALAAARSRGRIVPPSTMQDMEAVSAEFRAERVQEAPKRLERAVAGLRTQALRYPPRKEGPAPQAEALSGIADREETILRRLREGASPPPPSEAQLSGFFTAGAMQRQTTKKTSALEELLKPLAEEAGALPPDALGKVRQAQGEQKGAEDALSGRDSASARTHQEKAMELLDRGRKQCRNALQRQQSIQSGSTRPFGMPRGVVRPFGRGGRAGTDTGFVPLPGAEEYQPPREIRKEVERSLRERRPRVFDDAVNEYLRRMSR